MLLFKNEFLYLFVFLLINLSSKSLGLKVIEVVYEDLSTFERYKLVYFDVIGRAEFIKFIFAFAGQNFIDEKIQLADWPNCKSNVPFKQLPVLEINRKYGKFVLAQSQAIGNSFITEYLLDFV